MKRVLIFLNYCSADQAIVDRLKVHFRATVAEYAREGVEVKLISMDDYCHGRWDEWMTAIARECDIMIPILTKDAMYPKDGAPKYINDELRIGRRYGKNMVPFVFCADIPGSFDAHIGGMSQVWYVSGGEEDACYGEVIRKARALIDALVAGERIHQLPSLDLIGVPTPGKNRYFVGRERELAEIHAALSSSNIMILKGEGGIGKTTLAEAYFRRHGDLYTKGYIVDASEGVLKCIAALPFEGNEHIRDEQAKYKASIRGLGALGERTILILDSCNTEIEERELSDLRNTRCRYIITSRIGQSELSEIATVQLDSMPTEALLAMFYARYPDIAEDNRMTREEMDAWLTDFFRSVGGHTLAVEMASVIMRDADEPIGHIRSALFECRDRIFTAKGERMSALDYLSVLYGFARLTETEMRILRTMCLISPRVGIGRRHLRELLSLETGDEIRSLARNTFLRESGRTVSMHPLISDVVYRREAVASSEECRPVVAYLTSLGEEADSPMQKRELADLLSYAVREREEIFRESDLAAALPPLLCRLAELLLETGDSREALATYRRALALLGVGDRLRAAACHRGIGAALHALGDPSAALASLKTALSLYGTVTPETAEAITVCQCDLGAALTAIGDHSGAEAACREALAIAGEAGLTALAARAYDALGGIASRRGRFAEALTSYQGALALLGEEPDPALVDCITNLGITCEKLGQYRDAIAHHERALALGSRLYGELLHPRIADSELHLGNACRKGGDTAAAREHLTRALALYEELLSPDPASPRMADCLTALAALSLGERAYRDARRYLERSLAVCQRVYGEGAHPKLANVHHRMGDVCRAEGDLTAALACYRRALAIREEAYRESAAHPSLGLSHTAIGTVLGALGDRVAAAQHLTEAVRILEEAYGKADHPALTAARDALAGI